MYYISPAVEKYVGWFVLFIFILSSIASGLTFYCLIKVRKNLQTAMRAYFIYIQVVVSLNEFHQDILFDGFPLFPQYAAYCKGVLCELKVPMTASFGVAVLLICHLMVAVVASLSHRHQSSLPHGHRLYFNQTRRRILAGILLIALSVPCIAMFFVPVDPVIADQLISRMLCLTTIFVCTLIVHISFILRSERQRSTVASKRIRNSFANLSIQLSVPNLLILLPASVIMTGLYSDKLVPFEVSFSLFYVMHLHTFVHSVMVIGLTPAYIFEKLRISRKSVTTSVVGGNGYIHTLTTSD